MVKWSVITLLIGDVIAVIVFIWADSNDGYDHFQFTTYNFTIVFNALALPIVSILTNAVWRKELIKLVHRHN
uniref:Uncharacterized protein n=1 Tax=Acrobeloides nanus TaxID=290746 RepID=A0A914DIM3_9BILA